MSSLPTAFSSMMPCALVFAADIAAGFTLEAKNLRRNEMLGNPLADLIRTGLVSFFVRDAGCYKIRGFRLHGVFSIEGQRSVINRINSLDDDIDASRMLPRFRVPVRFAMSSMSSRTAS